MKLALAILFSTIIVSGGDSHTRPDQEEFEYARHQIETSTYTRPKGGFVPDRDTAIKVAYAISLPVFGRAEIDKEKPFRAELKQGQWIVLGKPVKHASGGTLVVQIDQSSGEVSYLGHSM